MNILPAHQLKIVEMCNICDKSIWHLLITVNCDKREKFATGQANSTPELEERIVRRLFWEEMKTFGLNPKF